MSVQARFFVSAVTLYAAGSAGMVKLAPVTRGEHNRQWASATPSGEITLNITNTDAFGWFRDRLGTELAITFAERPADETP